MSDEQAVGAYEGVKIIFDYVEGEMLKLEKGFKHNTPETIVGNVTQYNTLEKVLGKFRQVFPTMFPAPINKES